MQDLDFNLDQETIDSAFSQIHYFINIPKHIKGSAVDLSSSRGSLFHNEGEIAHVIDGAMTVIMGRMNIPTLNHTMQFLKKTSS